MITLCLTFGRLLEPVHQDREAGSCRECITASAGVGGIATAHAFVGVVDHRQRCLVRR